MKSVLKKAKINYESELATVGVGIDQAFEDQYLRLSNDMTLFCKMQESKENFGDSESVPMLEGKDSTEVSVNSLVAADRDILTQKVRIKDAY